MVSPTSSLAQFISGIEAQSPPESVQGLVRQHVLDVMAGVFAGVGIAEARSVLAILGDSDAEIAGKVAMVAHAAESDPIHTGTTVCAGLVAVPPALLFSPDGATAIAAILAGYETAIRIGDALGSARLLGRGWWPTAVLGGAGAAAATARALKLNAVETRNALSLALIQSGGLGTGAPQAPESRNYLATQCIQTGIRSAKAAARGLAGPDEALTGDRGFLTAFGLEPSPDKLLLGLGRDWKIEETSLKAFPCALQAQSALDALRQVTAQEKIARTDIAAIEFGLPDAMRRIVDRPGSPASHFAAAASLQFLAAAFLLDGDITPIRMADGKRNHDDVLSLMEKVSVTYDADLDRDHPLSWPARVRLVTNAGEFAMEVRVPPGHPERPIPLTNTLDRFRDYSRPRLTTDARQSIIDAVENLLDLTDLTAITKPIREAL
jgi:2-methylcitrate dehydratase PrpD